MGKTLGARLKSARERLGISQSELGRRTGIRQSRISQLEGDGRWPSAEEWKGLSEWLALGTLEPPDKSSLPLPRQQWRVARPEIRLCGERDQAVREHAARRTFGGLVSMRCEQAEELHDAELLARFLDQASPDSSHDHFFLTQLLAAGAKPCWYAPLRAGFRQHCPVDRETRHNISDVRLPCLDLKAPEWDWLLFPQVTLQTRGGLYRLDALASLLRGKERHWVNVEVDGGGHDSEFDLRRQGHLGLTTVRLNPADIGSTEMLAILEERVSRLLRQRHAG